MKNQTLLTRTLIAAALLASASAAHAIDLGVGLNAATNVVVDTALLGSVKTQLATDARVKGSDISVSTENDVVILTGKAPTAEAKAAAEDIVKSANANVKIDNRIEVPGLLSTLKADAKQGVAATGAALSTTGEVITDGWISTKIKSQLLADAAVKGRAIKVTTKDNIVFLRGTVATQAEKDQAIALAQQTQGVARVNASKLKVSAKVKANAGASVN